MAQIIGQTVANSVMDIMKLETLTLFKINACQSLNDSGLHFIPMLGGHFDPARHLYLGIHSKMNTLISCALGLHTYHFNTFIVP